MTTLQRNIRQSDKSKHIRIPPPFHYFRRLDGCKEDNPACDQLFWVLRQIKTGEQRKWN